MCRTFPFIAPVCCVDRLKGTWTQNGWAYELVGTCLSLKARAFICQSLWLALSCVSFFCSVIGFTNKDETSLFRCMALPHQRLQGTLVHDWVSTIWIARVSTIWIASSGSGIRPLTTPLLRSPALSLMDGWNQMCLLPHRNKGGELYFQPKDLMNWTDDRFNRLVFESVRKERKLESSSQRISLRCMLRFSGDAASNMSPLSGVHVR